MKIRALIFNFSESQQLMNQIYKYSNIGIKSAKQTHVQHNTYYSATIDILAMTDGDIGCQESTKHYGSLLEAF